MQRRKIIVNNDTYETLEAVRMTFRNASRKGEVIDDADKCKECGAKYGKLLKKKEE